MQLPRLQTFKKYYSNIYSVSIKQIFVINYTNFCLLWKFSVIFKRKMKEHNLTKALATNNSALPRQEANIPIFSSLTRFFFLKKGFYV